MSKFICHWCGEEKENETGLCSKCYRFPNLKYKKMGAIKAYYHDQIVENLQDDDEYFTEKFSESRLIEMERNFTNSELSKWIF